LIRRIVDYFVCASDKDGLGRLAGEEIEACSNSELVPLVVRGYGWDGMDILLSQPLDAR
jgi:hypothetical protein